MNQAGTHEGKFDESLSQMYNDVSDTEYYSMFFDSIFHYLRKEQIEEKSHLDLGSGNGNLSGEFIKRKVRTSMGLDISEEQINEAKLRFSTDITRFQIQDIYMPFDLNRSFDLVTCIYALHFAIDYKMLVDACANIYNHLENEGVAVVLDITHDYVYSRDLMAELKKITMYEYLPFVKEGEIPKPWQKIKGLVHTHKSILEIDHIAIHGTNLINALKEVGFTSVIRKQFVHKNQAYTNLWGPDGFNHHLLFCTK